jgi:hypothetical protein
LEKLDAKYPALLQKHEKAAQQKRRLAAAKGDVLPTAEPTPSELAYTKILNLKHMKRVFPSLEWQALRNLRCAATLDPPREDLICSMQP